MPVEFNTKLKIVNDHGDVIEETTTNEFGAFAFRNIPADQNYLISIDESDITLPPNTKVVLTNKSGKELKTFTTGSGKFSFKILLAPPWMAIAILCGFWIIVWLCGWTINGITNIKIIK